MAFEANNNVRIAKCIQSYKLHTPCRKILTSQTAVMLTMKASSLLGCWAAWWSTSSLSPMISTSSTQISPGGKGVSSDDMSPSSLSKPLLASACVSDPPAASARLLFSPGDTAPFSSVVFLFGVRCFWGSSSDSSTSRWVRSCRRLNSCRGEELTLSECWTSQIQTSLDIFQGCGHGGLTAYIVVFK